MWNDNANNTNNANANNANSNNNDYYNNNSNANNNVIGALQVTVQTVKKQEHNTIIQIIIKNKYTAKSK